MTLSRLYGYGAMRMRRSRCGLAGMMARRVWAVGED
jgi:hypothetical protein